MGDKGKFYKTEDTMKKDDRERCSWATTELYKEYHDAAFGGPGQSPGPAKPKQGPKAPAQPVEKPLGVRGPQPPEAIIGFGGVYGKSAKSLA